MSDKVSIYTTAPARYDRYHTKEQEPTGLVSSFDGAVVRHVKVDVDKADDQQQRYLSGSFLALYGARSLEVWKRNGGVREAQP